MALIGTHPWTYSVHAIANQLTFTLHAVTMLIILELDCAPNSDPLFPVPLLSCQKVHRQGRIEVINILNNTYIQHRYPFCLQVI